MSEEVKEKRKWERRDPSTISLKPKDVIFFMKACAKFDIEVLEYEGLKLQRSNNSVEGKAKRVKASAKAAKIEEDAFNKDVLDNKSDVVDHMLIEDPSRYEDLLASKELEDIDEEAHD
jgi:hypothetical protein